MVDVFEKPTISTRYPSAGNVDDVPPVQDFDNEAVWKITAHDASYTIGLLGNSRDAVRVVHDVRRSG